ncbi:MAG: UDP-2,4-diacetamido-2,4,6-trideoxy-beta-L-altropyranose hydrolase [bacterium]
MLVVIRTDASLEIGTGHVMRCLTAAEQLHSHGAEVRFVCRAFPGNLCDVIREHGYRCDRLPFECGDVKNTYDSIYARWLSVDQIVDAEQTQGVLHSYGTRPDWIIADHYGLNSLWHKAMRPYSRRIMVIDDLANRPLDCDLLLDQNYYANMAQRYWGLAPAYCRQLLGPEYALLRREFLVADRRQRSTAVRCILVFFGGTDPSNQTAVALGAIRELSNTNLCVDVVIGATNPHREHIERLCARSDRFELHQNVSNMAELMSAADLAIGAGGTTTYERLYMRLPTLAISIADNQTEVLKGLHGAGHLVYLGHHGDVTPASLAASIEDFVDGKTRIVPYEFTAGNNFLWGELQAAADAQPAGAGQAHCLRATGL